MFGVVSSKNNSSRHCTFFSIFGIATEKIRLDSGHLQSTPGELFSNSDPLECQRVRLGLE